MSIEDLYIGNIIEIQGIGYVELLQFLKQGLPFIEDEVKDQSSTELIALQDDMVIKESWETRKYSKRVIQMNYQRWLVRIIKSNQYCPGDKYSININYLDGHHIDKDIRSEEASINYDSRYEKILDKFLQVNGKDIF